MKVRRPSPHRSDVAQAAALPSPAVTAAPRALALPEIYEEWFDEVVRWARALGGPEADLDDISQEVFLVVQRKLGAFDGRNLGGWLYRITANTVSDHRRRAWFRRVLRGGPDLDTLPARGSTAEELERREARRLLYRLLARLGERHRRALILFEIEGYSGEEIAALEGVPVATVWTRLHHARKAFLALVAAQKEGEAP